jgi:hypothetical protein
MYFKLRDRRFIGGQAKPATSTPDHQVKEIYWGFFGAIEVRRRQAWRPAKKDDDDSDMSMGP